MSLNPIDGKLIAIHDHVIIKDMTFDEEVTKNGIIIPSQNGKVEGIKARWGQVYATGPEQKDVNVGEWIYVEHGRWTRGVDMVDENGEKYTVRRVDNDAILAVSDESPSDVLIPV